jgi:hypothetical protein
MMNLIANQEQKGWLRLSEGKRVARMNSKKNSFTECDTPGKILMPIVWRIYASDKTVRVARVTFL